MRWWLALLGLALCLATPAQAAQRSEKSFGRWIVTYTSSHFDGEDAEVVHRTGRQILLITCAPDQGYVMALLSPAVARARQGSVSYIVAGGPVHTEQWVFVTETPEPSLLNLHAAALVKELLAARGVFEMKIGPTEVTFRLDGLAAAVAEMDGHCKAHRG